MIRLLFTLLLFVPQMLSAGGIEKYELKRFEIDQKEKLLFLHYDRKVEAETTQVLSPFVYELWSFTSKSPYLEAAGLLRFENLQVTSTEWIEEARNTLSFTDKPEAISLTAYKEKSSVRKASGAHDYRFAFQLPEIDQNHYVVVSLTVKQMKLSDAKLTVHEQKGKIVSTQRPAILGLEGILLQDPALKMKYLPQTKRLVGAFEEGWKGTFGSPLLLPKKLTK